MGRFENYACKRKARKKAQKGEVSSPEEFLEEHPTCPGPEEFDDL